MKSLSQGIASILGGNNDDECFHHGWISGKPPCNEAIAYDAKVWRAAGRLSMGIPQLRTIIAGWGIEISCTVLSKQLHALGHCAEVTEPLDETRLTRLEEMVFDHLDLLGWYRINDAWYHSVLDFGFKLSEIDCRKKWTNISHEIRQSHRWKTYMELYTLNRNELREQQIPDFNVERISLARQWAKQGEGSFPLAVGAVPSPALRCSLWGQESECLKCGALSPHWDHYWTCCVGGEPPDDVLMRRLLRPRNRQELSVSFRTVLQCYGAGGAH